MHPNPNPASQTLINELRRIVGGSHLLTDPRKTERYRKGFRSGGRRPGGGVPRHAAGAVARAESGGGRG